VAQFRKKPVVIEAVRVTNADFNGDSFDGLPFSEYPKWIEDAVHDGTLYPKGEDRDYAIWYIKTLEGIMLATPGDWIIQGVEGELYPCKPDIFAATYEPA
jgi:hypothetical protein